MNKVLEALERLKTAPTFMGGTAEYQACTKSETLLMQDYETVKQFILKAQEPKQYVDELKLVEKKLQALEILKQNVKVSIEYGEEKKDIGVALVFYIDNKKTIYVVDEAIKEQSPEHFRELELLKEVLE